MHTSIHSYLPTVALACEYDDGHDDDDEDDDDNDETSAYSRR